jgi:uncharacterized membrane protein HdeD (DUF308 family)
MYKTMMAGTLGERKARAVCLLTGVLIVLIGILIVFVPAFSAFVFDVSSQKVTPFTLTTGVRQIFSGALILIMLWNRQYKALGLLFYAIAFIPITDSIIAVFFSQGNYWKVAFHLPSIPVVFWLAKVFFGFQNLTQL